MDDFMSMVRSQIKSHGLDNQKQDLMYVNTSREKMIKVKVINHQVLGCRSNNDSEIRELEQYLKVLYNVGEGMNPDVFRLLEEMNQTYIVTDEEHEVRT